MSRPRYVSRLYTVSVLLLVGLLSGVGVVAALLEDGAVALAWAFLAGSGLLLLLAVVVGLAWPRHTRALVPDAQGTVVLRSPAVLVWSLLAAWSAALAAAVTWGWLAVTDVARVTEAGPLAVFVLGAVASLPELFRLVTGRLHRWRVTLTREAITYQGYRRAVSEPWTAVRGVRTARGRSAGVVVDLKASRPDLVLPFTAFLIDPQVLADAIAARLER